MVQIATEIHDTAPRDPFAPLDTPCSYSEALDTVRHSNQLLDKSSQLLPGSTCQYLFGDRRLATKSQSGPQAYLGTTHDCLEISMILVLMSNKFGPSNVNL